MIRMTATQEIQALLDRWVAAVRHLDVEAATQDHANHLVMFDVPEPIQRKGLDEYRDSWRIYFESAPEGARRFALLDSKIAATDDLAWVHALLVCTGDEEPAGRLTVCLRKVDGHWIVEHEHHSFPQKA
jgi:ketosteroid isomerase-like protein